MDVGTNRTMELAALGRPFSLGMFYDCRSDSLIPGMTLWDHDDLKQHIQERPQSYNDFEMVASESIEDKSSALNVEASLKASFFSGLVEVGGSAKYLNDSKAFRNQARVTLKYAATTKFQELSMDHLGRGNMKHPYVFEKGIATHVVTGILYGAQAFFVFDREVSDNEKHQDVEGTLRVMIKKIPGIVIEGDGALKMEEKDLVKVNKFSCKFHGDFLLQKTPTTFQEAVEVYQSLPTLLGANGENAVPMKVWLLPLTLLDSTAAKLVRQISATFIQDAQNVLQDFIELEMRCNDALRTAAAQQFSQISGKIKTFKETCSKFKVEFQRSLAKLLPSIRGGGEEEAALGEILQKRQSSPFNNTSLNDWMDQKEKEICFVTALTNMMKNTKVVPSPSALNEEVFSAEGAVCFVFTSLGSPEPYLSALADYLKQTPKPPIHIPDAEKDQWFASKEVRDAMVHKAKLFGDFAEANKENKTTRFLAVGLTDETQKGSTICVYKNYFPVNDNFEPPSQPESVTMSDRTSRSITLVISPPKFGAKSVTSYSVQYALSTGDEWKEQTASNTEEVTVGDLSPATEYKFTVRAVTEVGVSPATEVSGSIKTLPCSPPGNLQVKPNVHEMSVSWEKPADLGKHVQILSYIVEYAKTDTSVNEEDLQWHQKRSGAKELNISGLQSQTEYVVRVWCDCGEAGRSKESLAVYVCTTEFNPLAEHLRSSSKRIRSESGSPSVYKLPLRKENINGCPGYSFGEESTKRNRTILLFGARGSGKSTLIDGMINYIVGVERKDDFRFVLTSGAESQVAVYKINYREGFRIDHSLIILDAPSTGDRDDSHRRMEVSRQVSALLSADCGDAEINAVCFVAPAAAARLTEAEEEMFKSLSVICGKNVKDAMRVLVTFADTGLPPVLKAVSALCPETEDGLPKHFTFNNSMLFGGSRSSAADGEDEEDDDEGFERMFWDMGKRSMKTFFDALNVMETKSLSSVS